MRKLLPCPFCGSHIRRIVSLAKSFDPPLEYLEWHHEEANGCYLTGHGRVLAFTADNRERAEKFIAAWNRRPVLESVRSEALEEAAKACEIIYAGCRHYHAITPAVLLEAAAAIRALQSSARVAEPFDLKKHLSKPEQIIEIDEDGNVHSTELRK